MLKRNICLIFIIAVVLCLVSCGNAAPEATATPVADNPTATVTPEPKPEFDLTELGGLTGNKAREVKFVGLYDLTPAERGLSELADAKRDLYDSLENDYNFRFTYELGPDWIDGSGKDYIAAYASTVMAGQKFGDIVEIDSRWYYPKIVCKDLLYDIDKINAIDLTDNDKWADIANTMTFYKGGHYACTLNDFKPTSIIFWNKALVAKTGLKTPYELIPTKEWNWDTFEEMAIASTILDSEGVTEQYGIVGHDTLCLALIFSNGGSIINIVDNYPQFSLNNPNSVKAIEFANKLYNTDKVWKLNEEWNTPPVDFVAGKAALCGQNYHYYVDIMTDDLEIGYAYVPMGPDVDYYMSSASYFLMMTFPSNTEDIQEIGYIYNEYTTRTELEDEEWRISQWEESVQDSTAKMYLYDIGIGNVRSIPQWSSNFTKVASNMAAIFTKIRKGSQTASQLVESMQASSDAYLEQLMTEYEGYMAD